MNDAFTPSRRRLLIGSLLAIVTIVFSTPGFAAMPPLLEQAVKSLDLSDLDLWAYTMTTVKDGKRTVERFDPTKPAAARWELETKDGAVPTKSEVEDYRKQKASLESKKKDGDKNDIRRSIDEGTVKLISETPDRATYDFRMKPEKDDEKEFAEKIRGTLVVSKAQPFVETMELASTGEIAPMVSVKIKEFHTKMSFRRDDEHGVALPTTVQMRIRGRALFVKSLDADVNVTYADFRYVGKQQ